MFHFLGNNHLAHPASLISVDFFCYSKGFKKENGFIFLTDNHLAHQVSLISIDISAARIKNSMVKLGHADKIL